MSQGVIYFNKGRKCIVRLIVSLMTIRRHYDGPITVFLEGEHPEGLPEALQREFEVDLIWDKNPDTCTYVRAVEVCMKSPYDLTVWMDSDTVILGKFDELFEEAPKYDLVIAHFAGWKSDGPAIKKRILRYKNIVPQYMDKAIAYGSAINCGVYAFRKDSPFLKEWLEVAKQGEKTGMFIPDEVACQVLLHRYNCKIMPLKFNVSVLHDPPPGTADMRVMHFHGKKHCKEYPNCVIWLAEFEKALQTNLCNIKAFMGPEYGERRLTGFLHGKYGQAEWLARIRAQLTPEEMKKASISDKVTVGDPKRDRKRKQEERQRARCRADKNAELDPSLVTVVTACDPKYVSQLALTYPTWRDMKGINKHKMLVFVNGMEVSDERLSFLRHPNVTLVPWAMPKAANHREEMLTAFVVGAAKHVKTPYWLKLDADSFASDSTPLLTQQMEEYVFFGHRWGYSWEEHIRRLDEWAKGHPDLRLNKMPPMYDKAYVKGRKYFHPGKRTISFVQLNSTGFTRLCVELAGGERLPVPSQDTYMYYVANRLGLKWGSTNFKRRRGFNQGRGADHITRSLEALKIRNCDVKI